MTKFILGEESGENHDQENDGGAAGLIGPEPCEALTGFPCGKAGLQAICAGTTLANPKLGTF